VPDRRVSAGCTVDVRVQRNLQYPDQRRSRGDRPEYEQALIASEAWPLIPLIQPARAFGPGFLSCGADRLSRPERARQGRNEEQRNKDGRRPIDAVRPKKTHVLVARDDSHEIPADCHEDVLASKIRTDDRFGGESIPTGRQFWPLSGPSREYEQLRRNAWQRVGDRSVFLLLRRPVGDTSGRCS
jgi:hypothetical protein